MTETKNGMVKAGEGWVNSQGKDGKVSAAYMNVVGLGLIEDRRKNGAYEKDGIWYCSKCGEPIQEYVTNDKETDGAYWFIRDCACRRREVHEWEIQRGVAETQYAKRDASDLSYIPSKHRRETFETWDQGTHERFILYKYCMNFCTKRNELKNKGLCFIGDIGVGKSFAAAAIANWFMTENCSTVSFITAAEYTAAGDKERESLDRQIQGSKLVVLDDFGAERQTDSAREKIFNFVNEVIEGNKILIVTSNYTKADFNNPGANARIIDRILGNCLIKQVEGESMRRAAYKETASDLNNLLEE